MLVAFAILALSLGAILQAFSTGFRSLDRAEDYAAAVMHARSKLAEVGALIPLAPGEADGRFDNDFTWRVAIDRDEGVGGTSRRSREIIAYRVEVRVALDQTRAVTLTTLRLGSEK